FTAAVGVSSTTNVPVTTTETTLPAIMTELFDALENFSFMRYALFVGILSSFTFGVVGTFIVTRRISYIAAAISHSILGGIGASIYFNRVYGLEWLTPMLGAIAAALISAGVIGWVTLKFKEREDTIIAAIWTCGKRLF
ncbi:metal ABC transporter permease, partial [Verrucomicrobiales bacterium]|nr:metal ABC transporter permease [Verrucomicrobiales bacterium]